MIDQVIVERKKNIDLILIFCVYFIVLMSFVAVNSAVSMLDYKDRILKTQIFALIIGSSMMVFVWFFDYDILNEYAAHLYIFSLISLLLVLFFGIADKGSKSWFRLPFFSIQPSEFARVFLLVFISSYLSKRPFMLKDFIGILKVFLLIVPFFVLMIKQPDFSGILITVFPLAVLFFVAGIDVKYFYIFGFYILVALLVPFLGVMIKIKPELLNNDIIEMFYSITYFNINMIIFLISFFIIFLVSWIIIRKLNPLIELGYVLFIYTLFALGYVTGVFIKDQIKEYQYKRIESFIYPEKDPRGAGYNIIQARVALGSGGFSGKGIFKGSQTRLGFIPERHTDFIVSVVGEEMGFIGVILLIISYVIIINRFKVIAFSSRDLFGYYLCISFGGLFMGYFFVNIGMILGFFPVAGVPLPFLSYGGSNLVASFLIIGIIQSVFKRRISIA
ncbi:MAG: rod shape-determining protein RodA [Elusimicrobiales bacterium]|nr:rod shape-determining protein RodA [Elusimicrobiales bacterium]